MRSMFLAAGLVALAGQANALSCKFGNGAAGYADAVQNGSNFRAVIGTLDWALPAQDTPMGGLMMDFEGQEHNVIARFTGEVMGTAGARTPIDRNIRVRSACINGDCGYAASGFEMVSFLHDTTDGAVMYSYPCQGYPMGVGSETITDVQQCIDAGPCDADYLN